MGNDAVLSYFWRAGGGLGGCFVPTTDISRIKKGPRRSLDVAYLKGYFLRLIPANPINAEPNSQAAAGTGTVETTMPGISQDVPPLPQ
jgi:hypothetical protein